MIACPIFPLVAHLYQLQSSNHTIPAHKLDPKAVKSASQKIASDGGESDVKDFKSAAVLPHILLEKFKHRAVFWICIKFPKPRSTVNLFSTQPSVSYSR
jgi:hypothetical protein